MNERLQLTEELRCRLKDAGYNYFLITHVELETSNRKLTSMTVHPIKHTMMQQYSCTGIDDAMIVDILHNHSLAISIFVELSLS